MSLLSYLEDLDSQIPAIQLLHALGWNYLGPEEALQLRGGRLDQVILTGVLKPWLAEHNEIETRGQVHPFTDTNIKEAVRRLTDEPFDGLIQTNERIYHLLTLGTSLEQTIDGDRKGRSLHYIDWEHWENNVFHVTDEFSVERRTSHQTQRPDLVLFVNGIPFVVIECKRRDKDQQAGKKQIDVAIKQLGEYQQADGIAHLFQYAQLIMATSVNTMLYATVGTPRKFWSLWKEGGQHEQAVHAAANTRLPEDVEAKVFAPREAENADGFSQARRYFAEMREAGDRLPTAQDRMLWALLCPKRLLEFIFNYVVFDAGIRKIARYQQFFAVQETLARVSVLREGQRQGGVVWHTTGSGKSLTMVMLAKGLALHPAIINPRVVVVTDRVDLDKQISRTFDACGKTTIRARTGQHLVDLIREGKAGVITTVIDKFDTAVKKQGVRDENPNIFVLVDEGHRSNYGETAVMMRSAFPNACYLGFTGTPLTKKDKNTARRFGGIIHRYTMREAEKDKAVAPLLYEGRIAALEQDKKGMELWFERLTRDLTDAQKADLKRKMASKEEIQKADQRIRMIAYDISQHYKKNWQGTGFKAQLAADSRLSALLYREALQDFDMVEAEVIMSQPEPRTDEKKVQAFWKEMMDRFGSEKAYNDDILASFSRADGVEILIVVDKLLTGFDEPRNTVLYIDKSLKDHSILQAIARVNRLHDGKDFGYIIDYRGVLGELNEAMKTYDALADFDAEDVDLGEALTDTHEEVAKLPQRHSDLWGVFKEVTNKKDIEALERHLAPEDQRNTFYQALREYQKVLAVALSTEHFFEDTQPDRITRYKKDLKFFVGLRRSVQQRYAEAVDYGQYEKQIRKMMSDHIQAPEVVTITDLVNIFDVEAFDQEVERVEGKAAKADTIASRLQRTITERMDEDPVFYAKFADLVQKAIDDYRAERISELEYLRQVEDALNAVRQGSENSTPGRLKGHGAAQAYFGVVSEILKSYPVLEPNGNQEELATSMALELESIINAHRIRDWVHNDDVQRQMTNAIDDYLFDLQDDPGLQLETAHMDEIIERCIDIARKREGA
ncbi:MAG: HsdR family type I site-specific deoxyribonuclease [Candidatus Thiodiazotropha sp. (ex. Lucinisca nassula)]|nr:HsdR family type I site-specific deoxyribonuclease [Candidatus Thiodiazotropha sp. (ex. Lucinisca nassula)]MBW9273062.1 HsdR family type I site-specific deoxyribonuclease [Candidatus Thiodiazotropha sp. (ex. Lucinisca nassula)]